MRRPAAFAVVVIGCLAAMPALARGPQSDTKGRLDASQIDAINQSLRTGLEDHYDRAPVLVDAFVPYYPVAELQKHREGACNLKFDVATDGSVTAMSVVGGDAPMCAHALIALRHWKFEPAQLAGAPVVATLQVPFRYELR